MIETMRRAEQAAAGRAISSYPPRLFAHHMAEIYGISVKQFYRYEKHGAYTFAEIKPRIGRMSWSRDRVEAHFSGRLAGLTGMKVAS